MILFLWKFRKANSYTGTESRSLVTWGEEGQPRGPGNFRGDGYLHYLDCGVNLVGVCIKPTLDAWFSVVYYMPIVG